MINEIDVCKLNTETPEEERKYRVGNTFTYDGKKFSNGLPDMKWKDGKVVG